MSDATPAWATRREHVCITVACRDCGAKLGEREDDGCSVHFDSPEEVLRYIEGTDWTIQGDDAVCGQCTDRRLCASLGRHTWEHHQLNDGREFWQCVDCVKGTLKDPGPEAKYADDEPIAGGA